MVTTVGYSDTAVVGDEIFTEQVCVEPRTSAPQLGHLQLSIDICCPRPGCSKRLMSIDGTDGRTDKRHVWQ